MNIRRAQRLLYGFAGAAAIAVTTLGFAPPCDACEPAPDPIPETVSYIVTDDPKTAAALDITYQDNLDYEMDHLLGSPNGGYCEQLGIPDTKSTHVFRWVECYDVPINDAPRPIEAP